MKKREQKGGDELKKREQTCESVWTERLKQPQYLVWMFYAMLVSFGLYLLFSLIFGKTVFSAIFYNDNHDLFMDFFNSIRDASLGEGAYTVRHVIYPPMANLIFLLLSYLTPDAYNETEFIDRLTWDNHTSAIVLITVWVAVVAALVGLLAYRGMSGMKGSRKEKWMFAAIAVLNVPLFYMLERGNILVLSLITLLVFAVTYHSDSKVVRELGLIALAFSASLKLYPALFAWILVGDKRYKECVRCALYCIAMIILPSFCFGGIDILLTILRNIFSFSSGGGGAFSVIGYYLGKWLHLPIWLTTRVVTLTTYLWFVLCGINFILAPFLHKERWKVWAMGCITFIAFPSLTSLYSWALFLIPMLYLFAEKPEGRIGLPYFIPMAIPMLFIAIPFPFPVAFGTIIVYICLVAISAYALFDTVRVIRNRAKVRKELKETA